MTREEAIKKLKWFKEYNEEDFCGGDRMQDEYGDWYYRITEQDFEAFDMAIKALEQEPQTFKWCTDCKEYDQEKHCCHRWSKVIRDTVEEMKQGRCDKCEVGNPCLYCKHGFEPQESEET